MQNITRRKFVVASAGTMAVAALGLIGCGGTETKSEDSTDSKNEETKAELSGSITAVGASALQPLVEAGAEEFMMENPGVQITVQGGGSGQGLTQISQGAVDIGNSDLFAEEKDIDPANLVDNKVCAVGMGPVVNKDVTVDNVTKAQLKDIFQGKITNWNEVGGSDMPIVVINRASGSGTRATFEAFALDGEDPMTSQEQDNSGTVVSMVSETPGAISYLAFSYYDDKTKALSIDGVKPEAKNVYDNSWFIWSYEHMYITKDATDVTKAFVEYMMSDKVQDELVPELGYIPSSQMKVERDAEGKITNL